MPLLSTRGAASARGFGLLGRVKALADPFFNYVTMLLHGDGTNGAQNNTFLDSSTNNFTITRNGNTTQGSFSPYGPNWSNFFTGGSYLTTPSNSAFTFGTGDFTIELWMNPNSADQTSTLFSVKGTDFFTDRPILYQVRERVRLFWYSSGNVVTTDYLIVAGKWQHIAVTRSGGDVRIFYNGVLQQTTTNTINLGSSTVTIGQSLDGNDWPYAGYISNLRVVKGTALYTANFTPSTTPLTAISGTSLLTCADNRFIDDSTNNFGFTVNGTPSVQRFSPFAPPAAYSTATIGGSGYFDGNRDYLSAPSSAVFALGTVDFTMEHWVYGGNQIDAYPRTFAIGPAFSTGSVGFTFDDSDFPNKVCFYARDISASRLLVSTSNVNDNAWHHVAVTRASGIFRMYVDGVLEATNSSFPSSSVGTDPQPCIIAGVVSELSGEDFVGYLAGLRIVKGTAVYTSAFTPPAAPPTAVTNTSLLLNFTNGAIFDNAMMNDLETVGNAQISTSVVKFGTGSMAFDGSGDYLLTPTSPNLNLGSGNFTVECWFYQLSTKLASFVGLSGALSGNGYAFGASSTANRIWWYAGAAQIISNTNFSYNTWNHIAVVRNGSTTTMYQNGVNVGSFSDSKNYFGGVTYIGSDEVGGQDWNGYIDDVRITKGFARYTANFTPPTAAFSNQ